MFKNYFSVTKNKLNLFLFLIANMINNKINNNHNLINNTQNPENMIYNHNFNNRFNNNHNYINPELKLDTTIHIGNKEFLMQHMIQCFQISMIQLDHSNHNKNFSHEFSK